jgi:chaperonin GroEL
VVFLRAQAALDKAEASGDEAIGVQIIRKALEAPLRQLVENAGLEAAVVLEEVRRGKGSHGFNVATRKYTDLIKDGVLDPAKVSRSALQNASSIAALMLTTECMVTEMPERKKKPAPGGGGGGGPGGYSPDDMGEDY